MYIGEVFAPHGRVRAAGVLERVRMRLEMRTNVHTFGSFEKIVPERFWWQNCALCCSIMVAKLWRIKGIHWVAVCASVAENAPARGPNPLARPICGSEPIHLTQVTAALGWAA